MLQSIPVDVTGSSKRRDGSGPSIDDDASLLSFCVQLIALKSSLWKNSVS